MVADDVTRCGFSIDISTADAFSDLDGDEWQCPHPTHGDKSQCLFHLQPSERDVEPETVTARFRDIVEDKIDEYPVNDRQRQRFIGAIFEEIDLRHARLDGEDTRPIDVRAARFEGPVDVSQSVLRHPIWASKATFEAPVRFDAAETGYSLRFDRATFEQQVVFDDVGVRTLDCQHAEFENLCRCRRLIASGDVSFEDADITGLSLEEASVRGSLYLRDGRYIKRARLDGIDVHQSLSVSRATFRNGLWAERAEIGDGIVANDTQFLGPVHFHSAIVDGKSRIHATTFLSVVDFRDATVSSISFNPARFRGELRFDEARCETLVFESVTIEEFLSLREATITDTTSFTNSRFVDRIVCRSADFDQLIVTDPRHESEYGTVDLRGATVKSGSFGQSDSGLVYDLERATLGDVTLAECPSSSPLWLYRFLRTDFDDFDFSTHKLLFAESDWQLYTANDHWKNQTRQDPSPVDLEVTYLKAKNGASTTGDSEAASFFYQQEMKYRRKKYTEQFREDPRLPRRARAGMLALFNLFMDLSTGFGERPRRVVFSSLCIISSFAVIYWQFLKPPLATGDGIFDYVALSMQIFLTFVLGTSVETSSLPLTATAAIEGFTGAFFIALFVFTLTRSIKR